MTMLSGMLLDSACNGLNYEEWLVGGGGAWHPNPALLHDAGTRSIMKSFSSGVARSGALRPTPAVLESLWFPPRLINQARQKPLLWPVTHALGTTGTYSGAGEYTAASNPELRKNPGLYQGLSTVSIAVAVL